MERYIKIILRRWAMRIGDGGNWSRIMSKDRVWYQPVLNVRVLLAESLLMLNALLDNISDNDALLYRRFSV
jgi:hypothetical protein